MERWYCAAVGTIGMMIGGGGMPSFAIVFGELADGVYSTDLDEAGDQV